MATVHWLNKFDSIVFIGEKKTISEYVTMIFFFIFLFNFTTTFKYLII